MLFNCAKTFQKLLDIQYHFIIGRKGSLFELFLGFNSVDFHHLIGLHKLKDLHISRANRELVFKNIINKKISDSDIQRSKYYPDIVSRLNTFKYLETILDKNNLVFRYTKTPSQFSVIKAEFLLSTSFNSNDIYIFLDKKEKSKQYFCRSLFPKKNLDYAAGQVRYTLLYKEKIQLSSGIKTVQFNRFSAC